MNLEPSQLMHFAQKAASQANSPDLSYSPASQIVVPQNPEKAEDGGSGWFSKPTPVEIGMQAAMAGLTGADWAQTLRFVNQGRHDMEAGKAHAYETNPLLGRMPSNRRINTLIPLALAAHTLASWALPRPYRNILQGAGLAVEGGAVANNAIPGGIPPWNIHGR